MAVSLDTIYALSSGQPPSAIGVIRLSGPLAHDAIGQLTRQPLPACRRAVVRRIVDPSNGEPLDEAVVLLFDAGRSATGEAMAEIQCHGGRAVVAAILDALSRIDGLRPAEPGAFTRRAFERGTLSLHEVEALSDLLSAETESQRRSAFALYGGAFSALVEDYRQRVLCLSAKVETLLDFSDEGDVAEAAMRGRVSADWTALVADLERDLARPSAERLRDGIRVVIAGPVNSGKSTLLNALTGRGAAIVSDIAGTTRDLIEVPVAIAGIPFLFIDTAGQRALGAADPVERIGMARAAEATAAADILLWLGEPEAAPTDDCIRLLTQLDRPDAVRRAGHDHALSAMTGEGMDALLAMLVDRAARLLPHEGLFAVTAQQRAGLASVSSAMAAVDGTADLIVRAEHVREALAALDRLSGRAGTEDMLDTLFGSFCIGK